MRTYTISIQQAIRDDLCITKYVSPVHRITRVSMVHTILTSFVTWLHIIWQLFAHTCICNLGIIPIYMCVPELNVGCNTDVPSWEEFHTHAHTHNKHKHTHPHTRTHTFTHTHTHTHTQHTHPHNTHTYTHTHTHTHTHTRTHTQSHTHKHTHTHTRTHTHTPLHVLAIKPMT